MRITGIIAEYDPFHNGHALHIRAARDAGASHIVTVISGSFTQRGEPAAIDKWDRTAMALQNGADLVLELPLPWSMASAEIFAAGGVSILQGLGCVDTLSFGSECGDIAALRQVADAPQHPLYPEEFRRAMDEGKTYAAAAETAVAAVLGSRAGSILRTPNNTLGIAYIRAAGQLGADLQFHTLRRVGAAHGAVDTADNIASASYLRGLMTNAETEKASAYIPANAFDILQKRVADGYVPAATAPLEIALLTRLRTMRKDELAALPYVTEGLENRIARAAAAATDYGELLRLLQTRRYPLARIKRVLWAALIGLRAEDTAGLPPYIRVLGLNNNGREILAVAQPTLPVVSRVSELRRLPPTAQRVTELESRATDIRALALPRPQPGGTDLTGRCIRL